MLSILIPVYNQDVTKLVKTLMKQCEKQAINFEVLVYDDGSKPKYKQKNNHLSDVFKVNYLELSENLGRAKIRNWLAKSARFENLIFLDCDSKIISKEFIKKYVAVVGKASLISGGRVYNKKPPRAKSKTFHWKYGVKRESLPAKRRNESKVVYFHTNNFMVTRDIMDKYPFDDNIKGYGYEDLMFAKRLDDKGIEILHIDNPVEHLGLEKTETFLTKKLNGVSTLVKLQKESNAFKTRFIKLIELIEKFGLQNRVSKYFMKNEQNIRDNLHSANPKLYNYDIIRIHHYFKEKNQSGI